jgi:hypothetical protein
MIPYIYTIKVFPNFLIYKALNLNSSAFEEFIISDEVNQYEELITHIRTPELIMIGFNNLQYDARIIKYLNESYGVLSKMDYRSFMAMVNEKSKEILTGEKVYMRFEIPQLDVYKIFNFDSDARSCSIRHCMISLGMPEVGDCPVKYDQIITQKQQRQVSDYVHLEAMAIKCIFLCALGKSENPNYKNHNVIELRQRLSKKYNKDFMNTSTIRIGETIMRDLYAKRKGLSLADLKNMQVTPGPIHVKDCIPDYIRFTSDEFNELLETLKSKTIESTTNAIDETVIFGGAKFYYGCGGLHQAVKGIYESDEDYIILDCDVASLYPSIAAENNYYPKHLGPEFLEIYKELIDVRLKEKAKSKLDRDYTIIDGYKLIINAIYGKSNEPTSFLYDPSYTMKTTLTGECCLSMLIETLGQIPEIQYLNSNTDGLVVRIPREYKGLYDKICIDWMANTGLTLEFNEYKKLIQKDVSNYIAVYFNDEVKLKGCFEIFQELHKNPSMRIVPIALKEYFVNGKPIKETIEKHDNILDFCIMTKCNRDYNLWIRSVDENGIHEKMLGSIVRYYIGGYNSELYKNSLKTGAESSVCKGYGVKEFNTYKVQNDYKVNYEFYVKECRKIIDSIEDKQLKLF